MNPQKTLNNPIDELGYYMAPSTYKQIKKGRDDVLKSDLDRVFVVDGREGFAGKSTFAFQAAYAFDPSFCLDRIVFSSKDFENCLRTANKGQAIVFDEAFRGLSSKGSVSKENKKLVQLLMEVRQQNLFIFIVLPSFFMLEKYVGIFRSHCLFHCYSSKKTSKRRYYKVYNYQNKKLLYIFGKQLMNYVRPKISKAYRFYAKFPPTIDRQAYIDKKLAAFQDFAKEDDEKIDNHVLQRTILSKHLKEIFKMDYTEQSKLLKNGGSPVDSTALSRHAKNDTFKMPNE